MRLTAATRLEHWLQSGAAATCWDLWEQIAPQEDLRSAAIAKSKDLALLATKHGHWSHALAEVGTILAHESLLLGSVSIWRSFQEAIAGDACDWGPDLLCRQCRFDVHWLETVIPTEDWPEWQRLGWVLPVRSDQAPDGLAIPIAREVTVCQRCGAVALGLSLLRDYEADDQEDYWDVL